MLAASCLLFISQFFNYSTSEFVKPMTDINLNYYGGSYTAAKTGWDWHSWYSGLVIALIAYLFYSKTRSMVFYILSVIFMLADSLGTGLGANLGMISVAVAGYAIYLKRKESKPALPKVV